MLAAGAIGLSGIGLLGASGTVAAESSPTARLAGPIQVPVGEEVTFDASQSTPDDELVEYRWITPNDGRLDKSGSTITHEFTEQAGDNGIQVTVEDEQGNTDFTAMRVRVVEDGPVPALIGPDATDVGDRAYVAVDAERVDVGTIEEYEWTVTRESDGETIAEVSGSDELGIGFTPEEQDTYYTVEGVLVDEDGNETIGTHVLQTAPHPIAVLEGPEEVTVGEEVTFRADDSKHSADDGTIDEYRWYVQGEGEADENGDTLTYTFTETGYTGVEVTVTDENGYTDSEAMRVNVTSD